ncbi:MAG: glycerophosphodiester phosphodiesterase [Promethearchaeota archaeon]
MNEKIVIIAHRGANNLAPENTIKAFELAIELGADFIEFDVRISKDKKIIILHDPGVFRTTHKLGSLKRLTIEKIKSLDAGDGQKIPTLEELLEFTKGKINYMCEIKVKDIVEDVLNILNNNNVIDSTILISFKHRELIKSRSKFLQLRLGAIVPRGIGWIINWFFKKKLILSISKQNFYSINPFYMLVNKKFVDYAHHLGLKVFPWTVNSRKKIEKLINMGVDGILTNNILVMKQMF